jgi:hypothetical protein
VPPAIYTAPVVAEYQRPALQLPRASARESVTREPAARELNAREVATRERDAAPREPDRGRDERTREERPVADQLAEPAAPGGQLRRLPTRTQAREVREVRETERDRDREREREREPIAPQPAQRSAAHSIPQHGTGAHGGSVGRDGSARDGAARDSAPRDGAARDCAPRDSAPRDSAARDGAPRDTAAREATARDNGAGRENARDGWDNGRDGAANGGPNTPSARSAPYSGPQPVMPSGYHPQQPAVSLADAVQAAHEEGQDFGESVARDAPALWLEAVLARKPRMPSDLEARLLQGSALPIDFLLHDEVRHALRRGFWDALERTRR